MEAGVAAAGRVAASGGSEIDARVAQAGVRVETQMAAAGATNLEIQSAVGQAMANERRRLEAQAAERDVFGQFRDSSSGDGGGGGGGPEAFLSQVAGLREMQTAIEAAAERTRMYEQEVALLDTALANGLVSQQRYNELLGRAQDMYGQAMQGAYDYMNALESVNNRAMRSMEDAIMGVVDGSQSASDAFRNMGQQILNEAMRLLVVRPLMESLFGGGGGTGGLIGNLIGGAFVAPNATGNAFMGGNVVPFADGGVVSAPTLFPMRGSQTGLMGEAGPEAIMPLKRTKSGKLGVAMEGGGAQAPVFNMSYSFQGGVTQADLARAVPVIVEQTKQSVIDSVQRGGSIAKVFRG
jgi:lambda family phage tail tape measure protein